MKQMKRAFAMLFCVAMVLSLCTMFATAAKECKASEIQGFRTNTYDVFYVTTGSKSNAKITMKQEKGYVPVEPDPTGFGLLMVNYADYHVKVYEKTSDGYVYKKNLSKDWTWTTCTIKNLAKNTEYKIKVEPYDDTNWVQFPTWKISSSKGIDKFAFSFTCQ